MTRNGAKRRSGNQESYTFSVDRRSSKKSSSRDRHGRIYPEGFRERTIRTVTPDNNPSETEKVSTFSNDSIPLRTSSTPESRSQSHGISRSSDTPSKSDASRYTSHYSRGKMFEEPSSDTSPKSASLRARQRVGSSAGNSLSRSLDDYSSIGYPSVVPAGLPSLMIQNQQNRQRLVKSPPHPLSPTAMHRSEEPQESASSSPSTNADSAKILQLMNITGGRMNGILFFRTPDSADWSSGYCAINVASGSLIYKEQKKSAAATKTLMPDLRGCNVQTKVDEETKLPYLSVSAASSRLTVQLRPPVPETFDSWLAALLCWQPLGPSGNHARLPATQSSTSEPRPRTGRRASEGSLSKAAIIKVGKLLLWQGHQHHDLSSSAVPASERAFASTWRAVSFVLHDNGQLKLLEEASGQQIFSIDLPSLSRSAVQKLDPSVLDIEYSIAIYYKHSVPGSPQSRSRPIFFGLEARIQYEVLFVLLRAFATPVLYSASRSRPSFDNSLVQNSPNHSGISPSSLFRVERQLDLRLTEVKLRASSTSRKDTRQVSTSSTRPMLGDSYAEVLLDGEVRARTAVKNGQPFWREDFMISDIPSSVSTTSILVKARDPSEKEWTMVAHEPYGLSLRDGESFAVNGDIEISSHDKIVGEANLQLDDLIRGEDIEQWWPLVDSRGQACGDMLMKVRLIETVVLMAKDYKHMSDLLHTFSNRLTVQLSYEIPGETKRLSELLLNIYQVSGSSLDWLQALIEEEIDGIGRENASQSLRYSNRIHSQESYESPSEREMLVREVGRTATVEANLLFRGNSLLTYSLDAHCRRLGKEYLEETLGPKLREIDEVQPNCEVDPSKVDNPQDLDRNWKTLMNLTTSVWKVIQASASRCPQEMRLLFRHIRSCAEDRYDHPRGLRSTRAFLLVTKSLQGLANMSTFGSKEPWMEPMNKFLNLHRAEFKDFIDRICDVSVERPSIAVSPSYATPIQILGRLPPTSREGFPSLPFLLDSAKNFAELVTLWLSKCPSDINNTGPHDDPVAAFHQVCVDLDERTRDRLNQAEQAERGHDSKWERLLEDRSRSTSNPFPSDRDISHRYPAENGSNNHNSSSNTFYTHPGQPTHHRNSLSQFNSSHHRALSPPSTTTTTNENDLNYFDDATPPSSASAVTWERSLPSGNATVARPNEPFPPHKGGSGASSKNSSVLSLDPETPVRRRQTPVSGGKERRGFLDIVGGGSGRRRGKERDKERE
ncbi:MAG: hypothetical protein Q9227_006812 [Pyrenula ochraceoflavens]